MDPIEVSNKVIRFLREKKVKAVNGEDFDMEGEGIGIHGDGPNVIEILKHLHEEAKKADIEIQTIE